MAKNTVAKTIDIKRSSGSISVAVGGSSGGGSVDTSGFLLVDGTRPMTGVLSMGGFAINSVGNVDGVDISAHAVDANAHHNQVHVLANAGGLGGDHTISGGVAGYVLRAASGTTAMIAQLQHADLGGVTADQHHTQIHDITSSDHTWAGKAVLSLVGIPTTTGVLGTVTPSNNVTTNVAAVLATNASGQVTVKGITGTTFVKSNAYVDADTYVTTPRLTHTASLLIDPTTDITLEPGGSVTLELVKTFKSVGAATGWTGNGFMLGTITGGAGYLDLDDLTVRGTMRVYELIIQRIRATNGAIAVTSTGKVLSATFSTPNWTITTVEDHGFAVGDVIRAQTWTGNNIYRSDLTVTALDGTFPLRIFTATKRSGSANPTADMEFVRLGNTSDTARQGLLYLTADELFGPYMDVTNGVTSHADWEGGGKIKLRVGNVQGVTSDANDYGLVAFTGTFNSTTTPTIRMSTVGFEVRNVGLEMYSGGVLRAEYRANGSMYLKNSAGTNIFAWNGTTLTVDGNGSFTGNISASTGDIAGWTITSAKIANSTDKIRLVSGGDGVGRLELYHITAGLVEYGAGIVCRASTTGIAMWAGKAFADITDAPFQVLMNGTVTMTKAVIKNGTSPTMQIDNDGIHFAPTSTWLETTGYLFRTAIESGTALGGMFGNYSAAGNFSTGIWANSVDGANAKVTNIDANIYINAISATTKNSQVALQASSASATSYIKIATAALFGGAYRIAMSAEDGAGKVGVYRNGGWQEVWDDYGASLKSLAYLNTTNTSFTGTGYFQTAAKLGAAWTALVINTAQFTVVGGTALYWKKFGDVVFLKGFLDWNNSPAKTVLVASADFPASIRPTYEVNLWANLTDGTPVKITIPTSGNVLCSIAINKEAQNLHIDGLFYNLT